MLRLLLKHDFPVDLKALQFLRDEDGIPETWIPILRERNYVLDSRFHCTKSARPGTIAPEQ